MLFLSWRFWLGLVVSGVAASGPAAVAAPKAAADLKFEEDVRPILMARCIRCHGDDQPKAGLNLQSRAQMLKGGKSGSAIRVGAAQASPLWEKIVSDQMPPEGEKLTAEEKGIVRAWIDAGAKGAEADPVVPGSELLTETVSDAERDFWSFKPPVEAPIPVVQQQALVRTPIDAFLLQALEKAGLSFSAEADRRTLIRRATFDLWGLPPSPEEVEAFVADSAPDAYEQLLERLLNSPRYGERWGRHWLDAAGYADSEGILDADYVRTAAWRYRDYVIDAVNQDLPYDRFLQEQIAGDEMVDYWSAHATQPQLPDQVVTALTATGFLRCASDTSRPDFAGIKNAPSYYYQTLDDTVRILSSATLGLTSHCARCHTHKYDPIPQVEYYRLQSIFMSAYRPAQWVPQVQRMVPQATAAEQAAATALHAQLDAENAESTKQITAQRDAFAPRLFNDRLAKLPAQIQSDVKTALDAPADQRNEVQKYLTEKFQNDLRPQGDALHKALAETYPEFREAVKPHEEAIAQRNARRVTFREIRALVDLPGTAPTPLLLRGDYRTPGPEVQPGVFTALSTPEPFQWSPPAEGAKTSGRRLAFARWLTQPGHPLTGRVLVNRVWRQHFGEGIVSTLDDFGALGASPSHPELLDWLAVRFVKEGWSLKNLHRLMMRSNAYRQQSSRANAAAAETVDPDNRLLWRQRLRRLEAEALRDAMLAVSGTLNLQMHGEPVGMVRNAEGEVVTPAGPDGQRRSIYLQVRRSQPLTFLQLFDQPVMETNCARRGESTVSLQALTLLNSEFMTTQGEALAARAMAEAPTDPLGRAVQLALGRPCQGAEREQLQAFWAEQGARYAQAAAGAAPPNDAQRAEGTRRALADAAQMLLSANEFAYVD